MTDQAKNINLGKIVFDDNNQERKSWNCLGQTCSRSLIVFLSQILSFCWLSLVAFGEFTFEKLVTNQQFGLESCVLRQDTFYLHQDYEQTITYKKSCLYFIGWSLRNWKNAAYLQLAKNWKISTKVWQNLLFYQHSQPLYDVMQKEIENLEFVQGVNFEFFDALKNNSTKYLLIFDDSCDEFAIPKPLLALPPLGDIAVSVQSTLNTTLFTRAN